MTIAMPRVTWSTDGIPRVCLFESIGTGFHNGLPWSRQLRAVKQFTGVGCGHWS